MTVELQL